MHDVAKAIHAAVRLMQIGWGLVKAVLGVVSVMEFRTGSYIDPKPWLCTSAVDKKDIPINPDRLSNLLFILIAECQSTSFELKPNHTIKQRNDLFVTLT